MTLSTFDCIAAITEHSAGFADATRGNLDARVEHCPGWSVADLVWHLTEVHWFWAHDRGGAAAPRRRTSPGDRPAPDDDGLVDAFVAGAARLVEVLREADQSAPCWTWAGWQQDVAFVTRHQVQEAAVHHWDAVHAAGGDAGRWSPAVAADCVDEFLHFSVASDDDPDDPATPPLDGALAFRATDTGDAWTLDRRHPARHGAGRERRRRRRAGRRGARAADLLLWLYGRVELDTSAVPDDLLARFRAICFTD